MPLCKACWAYTTYRMQRTAYCIVWHRVCRVPHLCVDQHLSPCRCPVPEVPPAGREAQPSWALHATVHSCCCTTAVQRAWPAATDLAGSWQQQSPSRWFFSILRKLLRLEERGPIGAVVHHVSSLKLPTTFRCTSESGPNKTRSKCFSKLLWTRKRSKQN